MLPKTEACNQRNEFGFITALRALAILLITWDHLVGGWLDGNNVSWLPLSLSRSYVTQPLGIIQDFGFIGVCLILLTSGFLIAYVAESESRKEFLFKRLTRIYPPLIFSIILIFISYSVYFLVTGTPTFVQSLYFEDFVLSSTLLNYLIIPQIAINPVAWILIIEVVFYFCIFILLPFIKKNPRNSILILIIFTVTCISLSRNFGDNFFIFAVIISYLPILFLGQIAYYYRSKKFSGAEFFVSSISVIACFIVAIIVVNSAFITLENSYLISFVYAYGIFLLSLFSMQKMKPGRILGFFAKISYSFYLNQTITLLFISLLFPILGFELSLLISFLLLTIVAYLSWRFIEKPSRKLSFYLNEIRI